MLLREGFLVRLLLGVSLRLCEPETLADTTCDRVEDPDSVPLPLGVFVTLVLRDSLGDGLAVVAGDIVMDVLGVGETLAVVLTVPATESVDEPDGVAVTDSVTAPDRVEVPVCVTDIVCEINDAWDRDCVDVVVTLGDGKLEQAFGGNSAGPASDVTCSAGSHGAAIRKEVGAHATMDAPEPNASTPE